CDWILGSFFFSSRSRHTRFSRDWSSDVCSSDLDVLDDYSVAAVLEQIESSSLPDDAERVEDESIEHEPATRRLAEHESPVHESRSEERRVGKEGRPRCTHDKGDER